MIHKKIANWQPHIILPHVKHRSTLEQDSLKGHTLLAVGLSQSALLMPAGDRPTFYGKIQGEPPTYTPRTGSAAMHNYDKQNIKN